MAAGVAGVADGEDGEEGSHGHEHDGGAGGGWISRGLAPGLVLVLVVTAAFFVARRRLGATLNESVRAVAVLLAVAFAVLTAVGVWFRGEGMALVWPWVR